ncbi:MAG TPA: FkbM family methyltransferase [Nodosilinea sp.]|nr:FkbM family methyltransferase [Nodosilinea sp.]
MASPHPPLLLRLLPERLRLSAWYRLYAGKHAAWPGLYAAAPLAYAPQVKLSLLPGDHISDQIAFTGFYELGLTRRVVDLARQGGTMVDIGANLGYFSCLWAAGNPNNHCYAFEASPRNLDRLQTNIHRNGFDPNITLLPLAAGRAAGQLSFEVGPAEQTGWGGFTTDASATSIAVEVVRVDQAIPADRPIDLLKIDIEGADTWALMGCKALLQPPLVKEIWYEQNKRRMKLLGIELDQAQQFLADLGYRCTPQGDPTQDVVEWRAVPT